MESPRLIGDPLYRSTCNIKKIRTDQVESKLTEPNSGFLFFRKSDEPKW